MEELCTAAPVLRLPLNPQSSTQFIGGVHLNGRPYQQGDHVEYSTLENNDETCLGTINAFYGFGTDKPPNLFVEITVIEFL